MLALRSTPGRPRALRFAKEAPDATITGIPRSNSLAWSSSSSPTFARRSRGRPSYSLPLTSFCTAFCLYSVLCAAGTLTSFATVGEGNRSTGIDLHTCFWRRQTTVGAMSAGFLEAPPARAPFRCGSCSFPPITAADRILSKQCSTTRISGLLTLAWNSSGSPIFMQRPRRCGILRSSEHMHRWC